MAENMAKKTTTKTTTAPKAKEVETTKFEPTDLIECVSITAGELIMIGKKSGNLYRWTNYGDTQEVEYQDLKSEKLNRSSNYIYSPLLMINNDEVLRSSDFKGVSEVYQNILSLDDIDEIFNLDLGNFKRTISSLPVGLKNTIKSLAVEKIADGSFDSMNKIKCLDEILGTDLVNSYLSE